MPIFSEKNIAQSLYLIAVEKGVEYCVISPGSRNAPLVISFSNSQKIEALSIIDERSAGFFAIGMAQKTKKPIVLICTSGTALLNYYPAMVEAFYQNLPLIVVSADRPKSYIDQFRGQTIRQNNIYDNYIKTFDISQTDDNDELIYSQRLINEAFNLSLSKRIPSHINISFSEPLYSTTKKTILKPKIINITQPKKELKNIDKFVDRWNNYKNKVILVGQGLYDREFNQQLNEISQDRSVIILSENTSNVFGDYIINNPERYINQITNVDLLITCANGIVSKNLKIWLSKMKVSQHWHIDDLGKFPDTYDILNEAIEISPIEFFRQLSRKIKFQSDGISKFFFENKENIDSKIENMINKMEYSDLKIFNFIFNNIPPCVDIHLANSTVVRYANLFSLAFRANFFCNRGTSGIEGSMSTALGYSYLSSSLNLLIIGDISFFYDSNALWNDYINESFRIVLINNYGGAIFNIIDRVDDNDTFEKFFRTRHNLDAKHICRMYGLEYRYCESMSYISESFNGFFEPSDRPILMEIKTDSDISAKIIKDYERYLYN